MKTITKFAFGTAMALAIAVPNLSTVSAATPLSPFLDEQTRDVSDFTKVKLMGSFDVDVTVGEKISVHVTAPDSLIDKIVTEVKDNTLRVKYEKNFRWDREWNNQKVLVTVTMPSLEAAGLYGSGDLSVDGGKGDSLSVSLKGSGDVIVNDSSYSSVEVSLMGSGDVKIDGECDTAAVSIKGSGDVSASDLKCKDVEVHVKGSGDADVYASSSVEASTYGSGDITVHGNPKNSDKTERGSGDIYVKN